MIEDDPPIAKRIVRGLRSEGFDTELVTDGERGAHQPLREAYDLIVLDLQLPGMHGLELLELWRGRLSTPVIVLTSSSELTSRLEAFDRGAVDYMPKPFWVEELVARIRTRLRLLDHDAHQQVASALQMCLEEAAREAHDADTRAIAEDALEQALYVTALTQNLHIASQFREAVGLDDEGVADLLAIVNRVGVRFRFIGRRHGVEVNVALPDEPVFVEGDATAMEQAIANLVHNAVSHRDEGGGHIAVVLEPEGAESFVLRICDDGPGMSAEALRRATERGARGPAAATTAPGGSGLGLSIVQQVCDRVAWALSFAPLQPHGLEVTLRGRRLVRSRDPGRPGGEAGPTASSRR